MSPEQYSQALQAYLNREQKAAAEQLRQIFAVLPEKTKEICIGFWTGEDGEGDFYVMVSLIGPDLYVLNQPIRELSTLCELKTHFTSREAMDAAIARGDPIDTGGLSEEQVRQIHQELITAWLHQVWQQVRPDTPQLPCVIEDRVSQEIVDVLADAPSRI